MSAVLGPRTHVPMCGCMCAPAHAGLFECIVVIVGAFFWCLGEVAALISQSVKLLCFYFSFAHLFSLFLQCNPCVCEGDGGDWQDSKSSCPYCDFTICGLV
jgi:hypothetical protein